MSQLKAAAYIRVSTDEQLEFSPDSQLKNIREYAARNALSLPEEHIYIDEGISGRKAEKRPAFMAMIAAAKQKPRPFDRIIVWKFSRFARSREDSIVYKSMLRRECGVEVLSVSEQLGDDNISILIEALLEAMDEYYSINLAEEVKRGMNEKFSRGGVVSVPPFGYGISDGVFVPDGNAEHVRRIYGDFLDGAGLRTIAAELNARGLRTPRGNPFESRTVRYILSNPTYTGRLWRRKEKGNACFSPENDTVVSGGHEPIISDELFRKAAEMLKAREQKNVKYRREGKSDFALRGLVRCSECGATLTQAVKGTTLQCCRYARGACKKSHSVSLSAITSAVEEKILGDFGGIKISVRSKTRTPPPDNTLERDRKKLARIQLAYEEGVDTLEEYKRKKSEILARISEAEEKLKSYKAAQKKPARFTGRLSEIYPKLDETAKNAVLRAVCSKIVYYTDSRKAEIYYFLSNFRVHSNCE